MPTNALLVIPVYNAAPYLERIIDYWRSISEEPVFLFDSKSSDQTLSILKSRKVTFRTIETDFNFIEEILYSVLPEFDAEWTIRMDSDELLLPESLFRIRKKIREVRSGVSMMSISRNSILEKKGGFFIADQASLISSSCDCDPVWLMPTRHSQARIVSVRNCLPFPVLHSPGLVPKEGFSIEPINSYGYFHLDWVLNNYSSRKLKFDKYLYLNSETSVAQRCYYLPEDCNRMKRAKYHSIEIPYF